MSIRRAQSADAPELARFAAEVFRDTFLAQNRAEDVDRYVAEAFSVERQIADIHDPGSVILLAAEPGAFQGYAHLAEGSVPASVAGPAPIELRRFYVSRAWQGTGLAKLLMEAVAAEAASRGARVLWLGVWERNPRAIAFYRKHGFAHVGDQSFTLGDDVQNDWVMSRPLDSRGE